MYVVRTDPFFGDGRRGGLAGKIRDFGGMNKRGPIWGCNLQWFFEYLPLLFTKVARWWNLHSETFGCEEKNNNAFFHRTCLKDEMIIPIQLVRFEARGLGRLSLGIFKSFHKYCGIRSCHRFSNHVWAKSYMVPFSQMLSTLWMNLVSVLRLFMSTYVVR